MSEWLRRIVQTLLVIVISAALVRLAWELLRPAVPALIMLLALALIVSFLVRRPRGW